MTVVSATFNGESEDSHGAATGKSLAPCALLPTARHVTVRRGEDATLSVTVVPGTTTPSSYTWKKSGLGDEYVVGGAPVDRYRIVENNNVISLTLHHVTCDDAGVYTLVAKGEPAGEELRSTPMELSVLDVDDDEDAASGVTSTTEKGEKPTFLRTLSDLAVKVGTRTRFLVEIRSASELKVRWLHGERPVTGVGGGGDSAVGVAEQDDEEASRFRLLHEGNFFCVDVSPVTPADGGKWTCVAENRGGRSLCSSHLNVLIPKAYKAPQFLEELRAVLTEAGTVSLECKVVGVPTPLLRWYKDGRRIRAGDVFALTAAATHDDPSSSLGTYTCEAVNCMGRARSSSRVSVVTGKEDAGGATQVQKLQTSGPPPVFEEGLRNEMVKIGEAVTLSCKVRVPPWPRSVEWYSGSRRVDPEAVVEGMEQRYRAIEDGMGKYMLEIKPLEACDDGEWKVVLMAENGATAVSKAHICMSIPKNYRKPRFLEALRAILSEEGLVSFECKVVGFPTPHLHWFKDGHELKPGDVYQLTGTNSLGSYSCIARNCMGEASSSAELTVEDIRAQLDEEERRALISGDDQPPKFTRGLASCEAKINENFRLSVQVTVSPEPKVSWYRDDALIEESTKYRVSKDALGSFHLDISPVEIEDQAEWKCVAINENGESITSCFVRLIIPRQYRKPRFLECLRAILSDEGAVNLECKVIGVPQPTLTWYKDGKELKAGDIHRITSGAGADGTCCLGTYTCEARNCMGVVASSASLLGFEERATVKGAAGGGPQQAPEGPRIARYPSLSTIHEERTSQMHDSQPSASMATAIGDEEEAEEDGRAEVSFSFDGREVSVSLYETPDLTEEEALQIVEMFAEELSEHVSEHNVVELPSLRFVKESSASGNVLMEAVVIDVPGPMEDTVATDVVGELKTEADMDEFSMAEEILSSSGRTLASPSTLPTSPASPTSPTFRDPFDAAFLERALAPTVPYWKPGSEEEAEARAKSSDDASFHTASQMTKERMAAAAKKLSDSLKAAEESTNEEDDDGTFMSAHGSFGKGKDEMAFKVQALEEIGEVKKTQYLETSFDEKPSSQVAKRSNEEEQVDGGRPQKVLKAQKGGRSAVDEKMGAEEEASYHQTSYSDLSLRSDLRTQARHAIEPHMGMAVEEQLALEGGLQSITEKEPLSILKTSAEPNVTHQMGVATQEQQGMLEGVSERSYRFGLPEAKEQASEDVVSQRGVALLEQQDVLEALSERSYGDGVSLLKTEAQARLASQMGVAVAEQQALLEDRGKSRAEFTHVSKKAAAAQVAYESQRARAAAMEHGQVDASAEPISESDSLWQLETLASQEEVSALGVAVAEQQAVLEAGIEPITATDGISGARTVAHSLLESRKMLAVGGEQQIMEVGTESMEEWSLSSDNRTQARSAKETGREAAMVEQQALLEADVDDMSTMASISPLKTFAKGEQIPAGALATAGQPAVLEAGGDTLSDRTSISQLEIHAHLSEESARGIGVMEEQALLEGGLESISDYKSLSKLQTRGLSGQEAPLEVATVEQQTMVEEGEGISSISGISKLQTQAQSKEALSAKVIAVAEEADIVEVGADTLSDQSSLTGLETLAQGLIESEKVYATINQQQIKTHETEPLSSLKTVDQLETFVQDMTKSVNSLSSVLPLALLEAKSLIIPEEDATQKVLSLSNSLLKSVDGVESILLQALQHSDDSSLSNVSTVIKLNSLMEAVEESASMLALCNDPTLLEPSTKKSSFGAMQQLCKDAQKSLRGVAQLLQNIPLETSVSMMSAESTSIKLQSMVENVKESAKKLTIALTQEKDGDVALPIKTDESTASQEKLPSQESLLKEADELEKAQPKPEVETKLVADTTSKLIPVADAVEKSSRELEFSINSLSSVIDPSAAEGYVFIPEIIAVAKSVDESAKGVASVIQRAILEDESPDDLDVATIAHLEAHAMVVEESSRNLAAVYRKAAVEAREQEYTKNMASVTKSVQGAVDAVAHSLKQVISEADVSTVMKKYCILKLKNLVKDLDEASSKISALVDKPEAQKEAGPSPERAEKLKNLSRKIEKSAKCMSTVMQHAILKGKDRSASERHFISQMVAVAQDILGSANNARNLMQHSASEGGHETFLDEIGIAHIIKFAQTIDDNATKMTNVLEKTIIQEEVIDLTDITTMSRMESLATSVNLAAKEAATVMQHTVIDAAEDPTRKSFISQLVSVAHEVEATSKHMAALISEAIPVADVSSMLKKYSVMKLENIAKSIEESAVKVASVLELSGEEKEVPEKMSIFKVEQATKRLEDTRKCIATILEHTKLETGAQTIPDASPLCNLLTLAKTVDESARVVATVLHHASLEADAEQFSSENSMSELVNLAENVDRTARDIATILHQAVMESEESTMSEQESVSQLASLAHNVDESAKVAATVLKKVKLEKEKFFLGKEECLPQIVDVAKNLQASAKCVATVLQQAVSEADASALSDENSVTLLEDISKSITETAKNVTTVIDEAVSDIVQKSGEKDSKVTKINAAALKMVESAKDVASVVQETIMELGSSMSDEGSMAELIVLAKNVEESARVVATVMTHTVLQSEGGTLCEDETRHRLLSLANNIDESAKGVAIILNQAVVEPGNVSLIDDNSISRLEVIAKNVDASAKDIVSVLQQVILEADSTSSQNNASVSKLTEVAHSVEESAKSVASVIEQAVAHAIADSSSNQSSIATLERIAKKASESAKFVAVATQQPIQEPEVKEIVTDVTSVNLDALAKRVEDSAKGVATVLQEVVVETENVSVVDKIKLSQLVSLALSVEESAKGVANVIHQTIFEEEIGYVPTKTSYLQLEALSNSVEESAKGVALVLQQVVVEPDVISLSEKNAVSQLQALAKCVEESAKSVATILQNRTMEADGSSVPERSSQSCLVAVAMNLEESAKGVAMVVQEAVFEADSGSISDRTSISHLKMMAAGAAESARTVASVLQQVVFEPAVESISEKPSLSELVTFAEGKEEATRAVATIIDASALEDAKSLSQNESVTKLMAKAGVADASEKGLALLELQAVMEAEDSTLSDRTLVSQLESISPELVSLQKSVAVAEEQVLLETGAESILGKETAVISTATHAKENNVSLLGVAQAEVQMPLEPELDSLSGLSTLQSAETLTYQPSFGVAESRDAGALQAGLLELAQLPDEKTTAELKEVSSKLTFATVEERRLALQAGIMQELEDGVEGVKSIGTLAEAALSAVPQEVPSEGLMKAMKTAAPETRVEATTITSTETSETDDLEFLSAADSVEAVPVVRKGSLQSFASVKGKIQEFLSAADTLSQVESIERLDGKGNFEEEEDVTLHEDDNELEELVDDLAEDLAPPGEKSEMETLKLERKKIIQKASDESIRMVVQESVGTSEVALASAEASLSEGLNKASVDAVKKRLEPIDKEEKEGSDEFKRNKEPVMKRDEVKMFEEKPKVESSSLKHETEVPEGKKEEEKLDSTHKKSVTEKRTEGDGTKQEGHEEADLEKLKEKVMKEKKELLKKEREGKQKFEIEEKRKNDECMMQEENQKKEHEVSSQTERYEAETKKKIKDGKEERKENEILEAEKKIKDEEDLKEEEKERKKKEEEKMEVGKKRKEDEQNKIKEAESKKKEDEGKTREMEEIERHEKEKQEGKESERKQKEEDERRERETIEKETLEREKKKKVAEEMVDEEEERKKTEKTHQKKIEDEERERLTAEKKKKVELNRIEEDGKKKTEEIEKLEYENEKKAGDERKKGDEEERLEGERKEMELEGKKKEEELKKTEEEEKREAERKKKANDDRKTKEEEERKVKEEKERKKKESEEREKLEAEKKKKEEEERKIKEENERKKRELEEKEKLEAEKKKKEEEERKVKEENERKKKELEEKEKLEAEKKKLKKEEERKIKEEKERKKKESEEREKLEAEKKKKEEEERKIKEENERKKRELEEKEKLEAMKKNKKEEEERKVKEEKERKKKESEEREKLEAEKKKKEEEERKIKEEKDRKKRELEEKEKLEAEKKKEEEERKVKEENERKKKELEEKEKLEAEKKKKKEEEERKVKEEKERKKKESEEREKLEAEKKKKEEEERKIKEENERKKRELEEKEKLEAEKKKEEEERKVKEENERKKKELQEKEKLEAEKKNKKEEEERKVKEENERKKKELEEKEKLEAEKKKKKEEEERKVKEENEKKKKESEEKEKLEAEKKKKEEELRKEEEDKRKKEEEERMKKEEEKRKKQEIEEKEERKKKEEVEKKKEEERKMMVEEERKKNEEQERKKKEEEDRKMKDEEEKRTKDEEQRKIREKAEKDKLEAEEKKKEKLKRKEEEERKTKEKEEEQKKEKKEKEKKDKLEAEKKKEEEEETKKEGEERKKKEHEELRKKENKEKDEKEKLEAKKEKEDRQKKEKEKLEIEKKEKKGMKEKGDEKEKKSKSLIGKEEDDTKEKDGKEKLVPGKKKAEDISRMKEDETRKENEEEKKKQDGQKEKDKSRKETSLKEKDESISKDSEKKVNVSESGSVEEKLETSKVVEKKKVKKNGIKKRKGSKEESPEEAANGGDLSERPRRKSKGSEGDKESTLLKPSEEESRKTGLIVDAEKEKTSVASPLPNGGSHDDADGIQYSSKVSSKSKVWDTVLAPYEEKVERADVMYRKKPRFETHLTDHIEAVGSTVKLTCSVVGNPDPQLTWTKDGKPLSLETLLKSTGPGGKSRRKYKSSLKDGGIATLTINEAQSSDEGEYACVARNEHGETVTVSYLKIYDSQLPGDEASKEKMPRRKEDIAATAEAVAFAVAREEDKMAEHEIQRREMMTQSALRRRSLPPLYRAAVKAADFEESRGRRPHRDFRLPSPSGYIPPAAPWEPMPRDSSLDRPWPTHDMDDPGWIETPKMKRRHRTPVIFDSGSHEKLERLPGTTYWGMAPDSLSATKTDGHGPTGHGRRRSWTHGRPAMFVERPSNEVDVLVGEDAVVSFRVTGEPRPRVTWQKGTRDITDGSRSLRETLDDYVRLTLKRVMPADAGTYHILIRNAYGTDRAFFTVRVRQKARSLTPTRATEWTSSRAEAKEDYAITSKPIFRESHRERSRIRDVPGPIGGEPVVTDSGRNWVTLAWPKPTLRTDTAPVLAYRVEAWIVGEGARWVELGMSPIASFDAFGLQGGREYLFRVTPRNRYGWGESVTTAAPVALGRAVQLPEFVSILPGQMKVLRGMPVKLECQVRGEPIPEVRWYRDGFLLSENKEEQGKDGEKKRLSIAFDGSRCTLLISEVRESDTGRFMCEASNAAGRVSTFARLLVVSDPKVWAADGKLRRWRMQSVGRDGEGDGEVVGSASVSLPEGEGRGLRTECPPQFTMRLRDRRVQMTYPVRLTCQVAGIPRPEVEWHKDGALIKPEEDDRWAITSDEERFHTLELSRAAVEDCGEISATAHNTHGSVSCRCRLVVDKGIRAYVAPEFLFPLEGEVGPGGGPVAVGDMSLKVPEGGEIRLLTHVEAYPSVGVMWHRDGVRLRPRRQTTMTLEHDGRVELVVSGATARDSGLYECTATNEVGRATTSLRVAVVSPDGTVSARSASTPSRPIPTLLSPDIPYSKAPMFLVKPRSMEAEEGDTVIIHCEVIGDPKPEVIWLRDWLKPDYYRDAPHFRRVGGGAEGEEEEAGGGGHEYRLEIPCARLDYTGAYSVIARNCHGEAKAVISLQIYAKGQGMQNGSESRTIRHGRVSTLPCVVRPLRDIRCCDGDAVTLECQVQSTPPPLIRWEKSGKVLPLDTEVYCSEWDPSSGRARLSIAEVYPEDEGEYTCVAFNDLGKAHTSACLLVDVPEEKETLLTRQLTRPPGLLLSAASTPRSTPRGTPRATPSRSKSPSIPREIGYPRTERSQGRRGESDTKRTGASSALVHPRHLRVAAPKFYAVPHNRVAEEGETVRFTCAIAGHPLPWASWDKDGVRITPTARISLSEKEDLRILTVSEVTTEDAGLYRVTIENEVGRVEASARLDVIGSAARRSARGGVRAWSASPRRGYSPSYYSRRLAPTTTRIGGRAAFACDIRSTSPYGGAGWLRNGEPITESSRVRISRRGRTAMLEIENATFQDAGEYTCRLLESDGKTEDREEAPSSSARLTILEADDPSDEDRRPPAFISGLTNTVAKEGAPLEFVVRLQGTGPIEVSWSKEGRDLPDCADFRHLDLGDGRFALRLADVFYPQDAGTFSCTARNAFGTTETSASLVVLPECGENEDCDTTGEDTSNIEDKGKRLAPDTDRTATAKPVAPPNSLSFSLRKEGEIGSNVAGRSSVTPSKSERRSKSLRVSIAPCHVVDSDEAEEEVPKKDDSPARLTNGPSDTVALLGEKTRLCAYFSGHPTPTVRWLKGGRELGIGKDDRVRVETTTGLSCLYLSAITADDSGKYVVSVENNLGSDCHFASLAVQGPPDPPGGRPLVRRSGSGRADLTSAVVSWSSAPYDGGRIVTSFCVEMKKGQLQNSHQQGAGDDDGGWEVVAQRCHSLSLVVTGLNPGEDYYFRVRAANVHGLSLPSSVSLPYRPPVMTEEETEPVKSGRLKASKAWENGVVNAGLANGAWEDGKLKHQDSLNAKGRTLYVDEDEEDNADFSPPFAPRIVSLEPGTEFRERFEVLEELGKGRYGVVHRVQELATGQALAAKFIRCVKSKDREKVREEVEIMNCLRHPKLLQLAAAFESPREVVMVMEYISGGELFERVVADDFTLTERDCILFMRQICEGVEYMHSQNIVHLDLKPENIMCRTRTSHQIKLIDFGLAKKLKPDEPVRVLFGTPEFIPPEIINYEPIGVSSDMWSVGVVCYVLLSGLSPFMGDNDAETFANITRADFDFEDEAFEAISEDAKDFISSLLVKRKEKRLTASQCLEHSWLSSPERSIKYVTLCTDKLKKFIIRRKWQKTGNAIRALGRMATLSARRNSTMVSTPGPQAASTLSSSPGGGGTRLNTNEPHTLPSLSEVPPSTNVTESSPSHTCPEGLSHGTSVSGVNWDGSIRSVTAKGPPVGRSRLCSERSDSGISDCSVSAGCAQTVPGQQLTECSVISEAEEEEPVRNTSEVIKGDKSVSIAPKLSSSSSKDKSPKLTSSPKPLPTAFKTRPVSTTCCSSSAPWSSVAAAPAAGGGGRKTDGLRQQSSVDSGVHVDVAVGRSSRLGTSRKGVTTAASSDRNKLSSKESPKKNGSSKVVALSSNRRKVDSPPKQQLSAIVHNSISKNQKSVQPIWK